MSIQMSANVNVKLLLVLADAAADTVFALTPLPLVLAQANTTTVFAPAPLPLVLAQATTTAVFASAPQPLVLADAAATAFFALALLLLVLTLGCCCHHILCTCSSASGARTGSGPCRASWLLEDVALELWSGPIHWLGSHHALCACDVFLVVLQRAPPAFYFCPQR